MAARDALTAGAGRGGRRRTGCRVRKTYKLYIGGAVPADRVGPLVPRRAADGAPLANACRASRKDVRDAVRAARRRAAGWAARTAMNRGQVLYRVAELMEGRFDQFIAEVAAAEGVAVAGGADRRRARRSIDGSGTPAGRTRSRQVLGGGEPGRGAVLQLHDPRADRRRRARRAGAVVAARARVAARAAARRRQRRRSSSPRRRGRCPRSR